MLYVYQSNQLADLAALFARVYTLAVPESPWTATEIIVQSQGMRRYLNHYLAQQQGIAANLHFSLPAGFTWQLTKQILPDTPSLNPFQTEVVRWRLLKLFQSNDFQHPDLTHTRQALQTYLDSNDQAAYHLAGKLADIFDQYLIYRNDWLENWQQQQLLNLGQDEIWQAELWRWLNHQTQANHRIQQMQQLFKQLSSAHLPQHLFVFGIATLAPLYLQLLQVIGRHTDVHIFTVNPSAEYWGNILPAKALLNLPEMDLSAVGHPLLASLGKQGRDFFDALNELENVVYMPSVYRECGSVAESVLHRLQNDIQLLQYPHHNNSAYLTQPMDNSIQIVSAHSHLRELQILKDQLLQDLTEHPDWQPHDIAVLMPHIEPYLPFIDAVFGQSQGYSQTIPYSIADIKISLQVPLLQLFEKLLDLMQSRFDIETILPLLNEPPLKTRFNFSDADIELIALVWQRLGIHWGTDNQMRQQFGGYANHFTWQQARQRTVLGWLLPEQNTPQLWQKQLPWFSDIGFTDTIGRAQQFIDTLIKHYQQWQTSACIDEWLQRCRNLLYELADESSLADTAMQQLETALSNWQAEAALAYFDTQLSPTIAIEHMQRQLSATRQAGFLRGGIIFCSMVPMRSLPFQCVCLLGLNDGQFPRTTPTAAFDLIARQPRRGDRARRDDDRYLFLESLLSAQKKLYLSYIGHDMHKNDELAPSALLYELTDVLAAMTGHDPLSFNQQYIMQHPLQPFSHRYFNGELCSSRQDYAAALNNKITTIIPFFNQPISTDDNITVQLDIEDFIHFWRNPVRSWLRQQLQWQNPYLADPSTASEPFIIENSAVIYEAYIQARQQNRDFNDIEHILKARSLLPEGILGTLANETLANQTKSIDSELLFSPAVADVHFYFNYEQLQLNGQLSQLFQHGQIIKRMHTPHAPDEIELYLRHLLFCAADIQGIEHNSYELYPPQTRCLSAISATEAKNQLILWLKYYQLGQSRPLPFFARTSLKVAASWYKNRKKNPTQDYGSEEQKTAFKTYQDSHNNTRPQAEYPEVLQVFGRDADLPINQPLFWHLIEQLLLPLQSCFESAQS